MFNTYDLIVPQYVLDVLYKYRVTEDFFSKDKEIYGERSIADRAEDLCNSFYELINQIAQFFTIPINVLYNIEREIGDTIWWCRNDLKHLGYCAPVNMKKGALSNRCRDIIKYLIDPLKLDAFRKSMERFGIPKGDLSGKGSIALVGHLLQIIDIVIQNDYNFSSDMDIILSIWNKDEKLSFWKPVFLVNKIRVHDSHCNSGDKSLNNMIRDLEIDPDFLKSKSGLALDKIYEMLTNAFQIASSRVYEARSHC